MNKYLINTESGSNGEHEVHKATCLHLPSPVHQEVLGWFSSDKEALNEAIRRGYSSPDGCWYCCREIHRL